MSTTYLIHSAKGQTWGHHKYIAIKNGRYIYPEDARKETLKERQLNNTNNINEPRKNYDRGDYAINQMTKNSRKTSDRMSKINNLPLSKAYKDKLSDEAYNLYKEKDSEIRKRYNTMRNVDAKRNKRISEASKRQSEENIEDSREKFKTPDIKQHEAKIKSIDTVSKMHDKNRYRMESGNVPGNGESSALKRQSDVNETKNKVYAVKNNIERTVKNTAKDVSNKATEFADKVKEEFFDKGKSVAEVAKKYGKKGKELVLSLFKRN